MEDWDCVLFGMSDRLKKEQTTPDLRLETAQPEFLNVNRKRKEVRRGRK